MEVVKAAVGDMVEALEEVSTEISTQQTTT